MGNYEPDFNMELQEIDAAEEARRRRTNLMYYGGIGAAVLTALIAFLAGAFSPGPESVVTHFLDATMTGGQWSPYYDAWNSGGDEVIGKVVRGYDVRHVVGDVVSVDVTFESKAGTDLHKTLRFTVKDGRVAAIE